MRRWWLVLALMLSTGVNLGVLGVVLLQRFRPAPEPAVDSELPRLQLGMQRLADRLGLDGEKRQRFIAHQRRFLEATRHGREEVAALHQELRRELARPEPDRQRVEHLLAQSTEAFSTLERSLAESVLASRQLLDPQQDRDYLRFLERINPGGMAPRRRPGRPFHPRARPMIESPPDRP